MADDVGQVDCNVQCAGWSDARARTRRWKKKKREEKLLAGETAYQDGEMRQLADIIDDWP